MSQQVAFVSRPDDELLPPPRPVSHLASNRFVLIFWAVLAIASAATYFAIHAWRDKSLPALHLEPLSGEAAAVTLGDLNGKVVLLNFWGTWCPPCRQEFPHIVELYEKYGHRPDFRLLSVSCGGTPEIDGDHTRLAEETLAFLKQHEVTMPTHADPGGITRKAVDDAVGFRGYPTTLLLDRHGVIQGVWFDYHPGIEVSIAQTIERLLAK
jgi:thiol-disulfide isomerase/thioredoxin